jgi:hypothetical protein
MAARLLFEIMVLLVMVCNGVPRKSGEVGRCWTIRSWHEQIKPVYCSSNYMPVSYPGCELLYAPLEPAGLWLRKGSFFPSLLAFPHLLYFRYNPGSGGLPYYTSFKLEL